MSEPTTKTTPDAIVATTSGSATTIAGGVSITMVSKCWLSDARTSLNRVEFGKNRYYYARYYGSAYGTYYQAAHS